MESTGIHRENTGENRWSVAEDRLESGDYLNALRDFLKMDSDGLVLVDRFEYTTGLRQIAGFDVSRNAKDELLLLQRNGDFCISLLDPEAESDLRPEHQKEPCQTFCTLSPDRENQSPRLLLVEAPPEASELHVYRVEQHGRGYRIERSKTQKVPGASIEAVTVCQSKVLAATGDGRIHQYNETRLSSEGAYDNPLDICRLVHGDDATYIIGIGRAAGLCKYSVGNSDLSPEVFARDRQFSGCAVADVRDIGVPDIVAFTKRGGIFVFDAETLEIVYQCHVPDELLDICCMDVTHDGRVSVLVGGAADNLYVFSLDQDREFALTHTWALPHRVRHLAPMNRDYGVGNSKALAIGLEIGEVLIAAFPTHRDISKGVNDALRGFKTQDPSWTQNLLSEPDPTLLAFALTTLGSELKCEDIGRVLSRQEQEWEPPLLLAVLPRLSALLSQYREQCQISEKVFDLLDRLISDSPSLAVCEAARASLAGIVQGPGIGTERAQDLLVAAQGLLDRIMVFRPNRQKHVQGLISREDCNEADKQLAILSDQRMDLLETIASRERILALSYCAEDRLLYTTADGTLGILDQQLGRATEPIKGVSAVLCLSSSRESPRYLVFADREVIGRDKELAEVFKFEYSGPPRTVSAITDGVEPLWVVGSDDHIAFGDLNKQRNTIPVEMPVARVLVLEGTTDVSVYVVCVTGEIYRLVDLRPKRGKKCQPKLQSVHRIGGNINVQGAEIDATGALIVVGAREVVLVSGLSDHPRQRVVEIPQSPTCITGIPDSERHGVRWIVGTRERGLHFFDSKLEEKRVTYLDDVPMALCCTTDLESDTYIYSGSAGGNIRRHRLLTEEDISKIQRECDLIPHFQQQWRELPYVAQLVVAYLAPQASDAAVSSQEIYQGFDRRIRSLLSIDDTLIDLKTLVDRKVLRVEGDARYRFETIGFPKWVGYERSDPFSVLRDHSDEIVEGWMLGALTRIQDTATDEQTPQWVSETFGIDPGRWQRAVRLSVQRRALDEDTSSPAEAKVSAYLHSIADLTECTARSDSRFVSTGPIHCSLTVPGVAFHGFDEILMLFVGQRGLDRVTHAVEDLVRQRSNVRIVLVVTTEKADLFRGILDDLSADIAILDDRALKRVALSPYPRDTFLDDLIGQVDIVSLSPFQTAGPVRDSFYGREKERHSIRSALLRPGAKSFAVIGPRRIGKTSLLLKARDEIAGTSGIETLFLDVMPYDDDLNELFRGILQKIGVSWQEGGIADFIGVMSRYQSETRKRLVLFMDEIDGFLHADEKNDFRFVKTLRKLINEAGVKVVVAGYQVLYAQMKNIRSPLFNMLEAVELGRLDQPAAHDLVARSLEGVYTIGGDQIHRILEKTGRYPNFIQYFCSELIALMAAQRKREIVASDIDSVLRKRDVYEHMVRIYLSNLDQMTHAVLFLLVAIYDPSLDAFVLGSEHLQEVAKTQCARKHPSQLRFLREFTPYDLHRLLELYEIRLAPKEMDWLMSSLVLASVLRPLPTGHEYAFALPDLPSILKNHHQVEEIATNYAERIRELYEHWPHRS